jgi:hypothetical protein
VKCGCASQIMSNSLLVFSMVSLVALDSVASQITTAHRPLAYTGVLASSFLYPLVYNMYRRSMEDPDLRSEVEFNVSYIVITVVYLVWTRGVQREGMELQALVYVLLIVNELFYGLEDPLLHKIVLVCNATTFVQHFVSLLIPFKLTLAKIFWATLTGLQWALLVGLFCYQVYLEQHHLVSLLGMMAIPFIFPLDTFKSISQEAPTPPPLVLYNLPPLRTSLSLTNKDEPPPKEPEEEQPLISFDELPTEKPPSEEPTEEEPLDGYNLFE